LITWNYKSGYFIKTSQPVDLNIQGTLPTDKSITIYSGWNLLPVLSQTEVPVIQLFAGQLGNIEIIKDAIGLNIYWPEMQIETLQMLLPGKSYLLKANKDFEIGF
jgi:hypothetical protein